MKNKYILVLIIILGSLLRFYKFTSIPLCLNWDEASFGYNAYSILKTARDEYGNFLPLLFKSFGDYKFPLYVYAMVPVIKLFGLNIFSVRLLQSLFGSIALYVFYLISKKLVGSEKTALISTLFLSLSPWHLQFVRGGPEIAISITLTLTAIYFLLKGLDEKPKYYVFASIFFALSMYTYFIDRIFIPLLLISFLLTFKDKLIKQKKYIIKALLLGLVLSIPIFFQLFSGGHEEKFLKTTVFGLGWNDNYVNRLLLDENSNLEYRIFHQKYLEDFMGIVNHYLNHFSPSFLFVKGAYIDLRQMIYGMGALYFYEIILLPLGIYQFLKTRRKYRKFIIVWLFVAPLASAITRDQISARRSIYMLFPLIIFSALGFEKLMKYIFNIKFKIIKYLLLSFFIILMTFSILYYLLSYYVFTPNRNFKGPAGFSCGYKEVVTATQKYKSKYKNIVIDTSYQGPYIFYLFFEKYPPDKYQPQARFTQKSKDELGEGSGYDNYQFRPIYWPDDRLKKSTLFIGPPERLPEKDIKLPQAKILERIYFPNGEASFLIVETI